MSSTPVRSGGTIGAAYNEIELKMRLFEKQQSETRRMLDNSLSIKLRLLEEDQSNRERTAEEAHCSWLRELEISESMRQRALDQDLRSEKRVLERELRWQHLPFEEVACRKQILLEDGQRRKQALLEQGQQRKQALLEQWQRRQQSLLEQRQCEKQDVLDERQREDQILLRLAQDMRGILLEQEQLREESDRFEEELDVEDGYRKPRASESAVQTLENVKVDEEFLRSESCMECAVCQDKFKLGIDIKILPCDHIYHPDCILPWLKLSNCCPVCRYELPTDNPEYEKMRRRANRAARIQRWRWLGPFRTCLSQAQY